MFDINAAISAIQSAASQRSSQIQTAQSLDVSALPNGDGLQSDLIAALQHSLDADQDYQSWAADVRPKDAASPHQRMTGTTPPLQLQTMPERQKKRPS